MASETIREMLLHRYQEITAQMQVLAAEQDDVRKAMAALGLEPEKESEMVPKESVFQSQRAEQQSKPSDRRPKKRGPPEEPREGDRRFGPKRPPLRERINGPIEAMPLSVLILKLLCEEYRNGATSPQLMDHIRTVFGRKFTNNSFGVILNVLKQQDEIYTENRLWYLADKGEVE
jgi:hypothetical protein